MLRFGLLAIRNDGLVKVSHEDTRVRKGIGERYLIMDRTPASSCSVSWDSRIRDMHDPDHAYEGASSCLSMNETQH